MKRYLLVACAMFGTAPSLIGQSGRAIPEFRTFMGATVPTGDQRDRFKTGPVFGVQGALELRENLHLLGTFAWSPVHNKFPVGRDIAHVLSYDLGLELGGSRDMANGWVFRPFVGVGAGARSYLYEASALEDRTGLAVHGAAGAEFQLNRLALRFEVRDNLYRYEPPVAGMSSATGNDLSVMIGFAYHVR